jgi:bacterioferritin-associated ferredoxin
MKASYSGAIVVFPTIMTPFPWHIACNASAMIVCSCNVLTDHDIRSAMSAAAELLRTTHQVYVCLGCKVECGRCVGTIRAIMNPACDKECLSVICSERKDADHALEARELAL